MKRLYTVSEMFIKLQNLDRRIQILEQRMEGLPPSTTRVRFHRVIKEAKLRKEYLQFQIEQRQKAIEGTGPYYIVDSSDPLELLVAAYRSMKSERYSDKDDWKRKIREKIKKHIQKIECFSNEFLTPDEIKSFCGDLGAALENSGFDGENLLKIANDEIADDEDAKILHRFIMAALFRLQGRMATGVKKNESLQDLQRIQAKT